MLNIAYKDEAMFDVKRIEGRRWHKETKFWSVPASLRAWKKLNALGFTMMEFGGGKGYVAWLELGCRVTGRFDGTLFDYQQDGVARLLRHTHFLLRDEPGLGKTRQAIHWARAESRRKIVVCPKVVINNWHREIGDTTWTVVNPEALPKLDVGDESFDLILDEAHLFTNTKARRTKLAMALAERAKRVLLLTGTPPSQPIRLWPFFVMTKQRTAKEFFPWALRYTGAEETEYGWRFDGATHVDELADEMLHWSLGRTKEQVLDDLPDKLYSVVYSEGAKKDVVQLAKMDEEFYGLLDRGYSVGASSLGVGLAQRLRVHASQAKLQTTIDYIADRLPAKHIVFCEFRSTMDAILDGLAKRVQGQATGEHLGAGKGRGVRLLSVHGETRDRDEVVREFWESDSAVVVCQYRAAGLGINLQCASTVVIHDLPWTPADLEQAIDRAHRIGQKDSVHAVFILSQSRVEQQMLQGLRDGKQLSDALYSRANQPGVQYNGDRVNKGRIDEHREGSPAGRARSERPSGEPERGAQDDHQRERAQDGHVADRSSSDDVPAGDRRAEAADRAGGEGHRD